MSDRPASTGGGPGSRRGDLSRIAVAGSGVLGLQIALQAARHGCDVAVYDLDPARIEGLPGRLADLCSLVRRDTNASAEDLAAAAGRVRGTTSLADALSTAELLIEAIPENMAVKQAFFTAASAVVSDGAILLTNSSTLAPSEIAPFVTNAERFLALHFANQIWVRNVAEVMGHPGTDPAVFDAVMGFAQRIGMVPVALHKEQPGYIINSLLVPLLESAVALAANDVADPHTIDRTWMIATGAPRGPFGILDVIGMRTSYELTLGKAAKGDRAAKAVAAWMKREFIDTNKLGVETGEGFYSYPGPRYRDADFLTG